MRLGGNIFKKHDDPASWVEAVKDMGWRAAYCPLSNDADDATARVYATAAAKADIVIAEVGAWSNPLADDEAERRAARENQVKALDLAERIGARCCVNIAGSRGKIWMGPDPRNYAADTFAMIVEVARATIDAVKPKRTSYTLEPMPWIHPDSPDSYLELIRAIDRPAFGVHLDPVNMINSPQRYFNNGAFLTECFQKLGLYIRSIHAKDIILRDTLTVHLDEMRPGEGGLDFAVFLREAAKLDKDMPFLMEHMTLEEDYRAGAEYLRGVAGDIQIKL